MCRSAVEVLIPDFKGNWEALAEVVEAQPHVLNHNLESIARLYYKVRPQAKYERSLELLQRVKELDATMRTKSGLMVGLGEEPEEIVETMRDLRSSQCDLLTIGQYLRPSVQHLPVVRYYHPDEFAEFKHQGRYLALCTWKRGLSCAVPIMQRPRRQQRPSRHSEDGHHLKRYPYDNDGHS